MGWIEIGRGIYGGMARRCPRVGSMAYELFLSLKDHMRRGCCADKLIQGTQKRRESYGEVRSTYYEDTRVSGAEYKRGKACGCSFGKFLPASESIERLSIERSIVTLMGQVAHGHILRAFAKRWLNYPMDFPLSMMLETGGVGTLSYQHQRIDEPAFLLGMSFPLPADDA